VRNKKAHPLTVRRSFDEDGKEGDFGRY